MGRPPGRVLDVREGELRITLASGAVLFFIVGGHTMLETARDALFLTKLPTATLNLVYVVVACCSLVVAVGSSRLVRVLGLRRALILSLAVASAATLGLHAMTLTSGVIFGFYVFTGLVGGLLPTQFWTLAAQLFTVGEGRRLFALIAAGGVIGGVIGASTAALVLGLAPVTTLLPVAAAFFLTAAASVAGLPPRSDTSAPKLEAEPRQSLFFGVVGTFRASPFLLRIAALTVISTATVLTVDYLFKSTAARYIPAGELGPFFARYYAAMNVASLVVQVFLASRLVGSLGVLGAVGIMPLGLFLGGIGSLATAGSLAAVLATKGVDGSFRYSLHRVTTELLYLAVPARARDRGKAVIDAVLVRVSQAAMAGLLYGLASVGIGGWSTLGAIVAGLSAAWLLVAFTLRRPYLELFRRAIREGTLGGMLRDMALDELDLESAEAAVEALASVNVEEVAAAMNLLARRQHGRLVPALVLYHGDPRVLILALRLFSESGRRDWIPLGLRLASDPRDGVRLEAIRALVRVGRREVLSRAEDDPSAIIRAYVAFQRARDSETPALVEHPNVRALLRPAEDDGDQRQLGMVYAISDTPDPRSVDVLMAFFQGSQAIGRPRRPTARLVRQLARTLALLKDPRVTPHAIQRLQQREGRDAVRDVLVAIGDVALDALIAALHDPATPRSVRIHIPRSIAHFKSQRACNVLTRALVEAPDGLVRYKALRGLATITASRRVRLDRSLLAREGVRSLVEHLRMTAFREALGIHRDPGLAAQAPSARLLDELLADKVVQARDRAFRVLEVLHRREDIQRARAALASPDGRVRANGVEFIDTLLSSRDTRRLRDVFRVVLDELPPAERLAQATEWLGDVPTSRMDALRRLLDERDEVVAVMAASYSLGLGDPALTAAVRASREERPSLTTLGAHYFGQESTQ